jgi:hypothetical protein
LLQTAEALQAAAQFINNGPLFKEETTGEHCVLTKWREVDEEEDTEEPL